MINFNDPTSQNLYKTILSSLGLGSPEELLKQYLSTLAEKYNEKVPSEKAIDVEILIKAFHENGGFNPNFNEKG